MLLAVQMFGIDFSAGTTWFVVAVAGIVLALTLSTRRGNRRGRTGFTVAVPPRLPGGNDFAAAQKLFLDDPRAAVAQARAIVARAVDARAARGALDEALANRYRAACEVASDSTATTDQLRGALLDFRAILAAIDGPARA